jgi:hypothetical protein
VAVSIRIVIAGALWLATAGAGAVTRRRGGPASSPVLLTAAGAVTAAVLADEFLARRADQVTESVLAALEIDRRAQRHRRRLQDERRPGLRVVGELPGRPA